MIQAKSSLIGTNFLIELIKTCSEHGVSTVHLGDITILFDSKTRKVENIVEQEGVNHIIDGTEEDDSGSERFSDDELSELKLTDPYAWEQLVHKEA